MSIELNYTPKMLQYVRAGARVNSRVAVSLKWNDGGEERTVDGHTVDISPKGCLAIAPQGLTVGQTLRVVNSINQKESEAVLIWRGHEGRAGWELGLELVNPPRDFWGVEF